MPTLKSPANQQGSNKGNLLNDLWHVCEQWTVNSNKFTCTANHSSQISIVCWRVSAKRKGHLILCFKGLPQKVANGKRQNCSDEMNIMTMEQVWNSNPVFHINTCFKILKSTTTSERKCWDPHFCYSMKKLVKARKVKADAQKAIFLHDCKWVEAYIPSSQLPFCIAKQKSFWERISMLDSKVVISRAQVCILQHEGKEDCIAMLECKVQQKSLPTSFGI